jgi:ABC-2 type transport system permease protein
MFKRILNFITKDLVSALRDNITLYIIIFPLISAGIMVILLPGFESGSMTFIVDKSTVEQSIIDELGEFGKVEVMNSEKDVKERVKNFDDVIGLTKSNEDDKYKLILEGNESGGAKEAKAFLSMIMGSVLSEEDIAEFKYESLGKTKSYLKEYLLCILILACMQMAAMAEAFNIVDEKEHRSINALAVSPMSMFDYILSRGIVIMLIALILSLVDSFILVGLNADYLKIVIGLVASSMLGILLAFILGGFANNQMTAIAIFKIAVVVYTGIPIGAIFVPQGLQWLFYIFPNYWMFNIFKNIYIEPQLVNFWFSCLLTAGLSILYLLLLLPFLGKRLKLR